MVNVVIQLIDYIFKALVNYRNTPEGSKEWDDITAAFNNADDGASFDPFAAQSVQQSQPAQRQQRVQVQQAQPAQRSQRSRGMPIVEDQPFVNTNAEG